MVIDAENGFIVRLIEKKCLADVKYLKYRFRVCFSISDGFKLLKDFSDYAAPSCSKEVCYFYI